MKHHRHQYDPNSRWFFLRDMLDSLPYWLLIVIVFGLFFLWRTITDESYSIILKAVSKGILTTIYVSVLAYLFSTVLGLIIGLMRVAPNRILREGASLYTEIIRGVPMLVILYYIAFVGAPALVQAVNWVCHPLISSGLIRELSIRKLDFVWRAILALTLGYSAFISEIFRAGIESINRGQVEASKALGMTLAQSMRHVILPQAIRNVLPPLCNEFVAMIKDSALVSALGVQDITQLGKVYSASTFKFFETYNVVAFLYLIMTITLSLFVRGLEYRLDGKKDRALFQHF